VLVKRIKYKVRSIKESEEEDEGSVWVCSPRRGDKGGSRISPTAADGGLQPKLHGRRSGGPPAVGRGSLDVASRRASPGEDDVAWQCSVVPAQVSRKLVQIELAMVTVNKNRQREEER
jgi:hypothetical protein